MPQLLVIDDDPAICLILRRAYAESVVTVRTVSTARDGLEAVAGEIPDVILLDIHLPDMSGLDLYRQLRELDGTVPVIFMTASGTSEIVIEAMKLGAYDYLQKPLDLASVRRLIERALEVRRLMHIPVALAGAGEPTDDRADHLVGCGPAMQEVYKAIGRVAPQNVTVLIRGESGTGKELVARAIYQHSPRAGGPFLAINCAAIPETLLESELFGHEKGAFTGADRQRIGKFEQASGGTLFLDEIGDMPLLLQSKMLRLLQEQRFERVGGNTTIQTNVRIIAATHRNLEQALATGQFRADLYYRLNVFTLTLPPLRDRAEDLPLLIDHGLRRFRRELKRQVDRFSPEALDALRRYSWPGNIRELESTLKQALLYSSSTVLTPDDLPPHILGGGTAPAASSAERFDPYSFIRHRLQAGSQNLHDEFVTWAEGFLLAEVLRHTDGNQVQSAKILGISRNHLRKKIQTIGLSIECVVETNKPV